MIACLLIPDFAIALARQSNLNQPLILTQSHATSERVFAVCAEAARRGVRSGMSLRQAQALCPQAALRSADLAQYQQIRNDIAALLATVTAKVEVEAGYQAATLYADLTGLNRREQFEFAGEINQTLQRQHQLTPAMGLAGGKFPAYVAAGSIGLRRILCLTPGQESSFLAPLDATCLPLEAELARRFELFGLRTVGQFAALPVSAVQAQFGPPGRWLHQLARGHDKRPVLSYQAPRVEKITRELDDPVEDQAVLMRLVQTMIQELTTRLAASGQGALTLHLTLHLAGAIWQDRLTLRQPTADPARLARQFTTLIERARITSGVAVITLQLSDLVTLKPEQLALFAQSQTPEQWQRLGELLPRLVSRYGPDCFFEPVLTSPHAVLPERRVQFRRVGNG
jgi:nucleotidyltransferase/DNA polymerase involved in DNA repair